MSKTRQRLESSVAGIAIAAALYAGSVSRHLRPGAFNDDAVYLALGRALSDGAGYRSIYLVGAPLQVKFPPGLPALLALLWHIGGSPDRVQVLATAINIAACAFAAGIFWWIGRVQLGMPAVLVAVFGMLPFVLDPAVQYYTLVLSEPLFLLALAGALVLYGRLRTSDRERGAPAGARAAALGLTLAVAGLIRTQGVALIVALVCALALERVRRRDWSVVLTLSMAPVFAWRAYLWLAGRHAALAPQASEQDYVSFFGPGSPAVVALREGRVITGNAMDYVSLLGGYLSGWPRAGVVACVSVAGLATVGAALMLRRGHSGLGLAWVASVVVLLVWPANQDRYLVPVLPLFALAAGYAVHVMQTSLLERWGRSRSWFGILGGTAIGLGGIFVFVRQQHIRHDGDVARRQGRPPPVQSPSFWLPGNASFIATVSQWALASTRPDDRIAIASPAGLWLYTGRLTVPTEVVEPRGVPSVFDVPGRYLASRLMSDSVTVVVVESPYSPIARDVSAIRAACPEALSLAQNFSGIVAYRARPGDACVRGLNERLR